MSASARGAPLAMIGVLLAAWVGGRALLWQSPFAAAEALLPTPSGPFAAADPQPPAGRVTDAFLPDMARVSADGERRAAAPRAARPVRGDGALMLLASGLAVGMEPGLASAHQVLWRAAMRTRLAPEARGIARSAETSSPPFLPSMAPPAGAVAAGRWSVDAWGFWRQGSNAAPIAQGRVPIYGASQVGAVLQYRIAPGSGRDPRLYARAYRALVRRGESELALGASARPMRQVPVRVFAEMRLTDGAFRSEIRPAAFAVTELAPLVLPLGTRLETYAQAGWVGGVDDTFFADGQASLTREIPAMARASDNALRLSVGAGAWGGAQEDAHRVDLGPTMRLDMSISDVPARLSLDWRERVEGDAGPESGLAVTLSTSF